MESKPHFDLFLSHSSADTPWVQNLFEELQKLGLAVFLDKRDLQAPDNFVLKISEAIRSSRFMALVMSSHSTSSNWVIQEWSSYMACNGPLGRIIILQTDDVALPPILASTQCLDCRGLPAPQIAGQLAQLVGDPQKLTEADPRWVSLGRHLTFCLSLAGDDLEIVDPVGKSRKIAPPWKTDPAFANAILDFMRQSREPAETDAERSQLYQNARIVGAGLFQLLFPRPETGSAASPLDPLLQAALRPGREPGTVILRSDDDLILSLPWELLYHEDQFIIREARLDLLRTTLGAVDPSMFLAEPQHEFRLLVNVSAPESSHLNYEVESYRIVKALLNQQSVVYTDLGELGDLVDTAAQIQPPPTGIHFSGHGSPGSLLFENEYGDAVEISTAKLIGQLRTSSALPSFFYLASCFGNTPADPSADQPDSAASAAQLHRAGVAEVVGYFGPIQDSLSTAAETAFYQAVAAGHYTRHAVRMARQAMTQSGLETSRDCRDPLPDGARCEAESSAQPHKLQEWEQIRHLFPFAWAQLAFYHRGPEHPLGKPAAPGQKVVQPIDPQREFHIDIGGQRLLKTGFIGRRKELHSIRRAVRDGQRVFVFQGLGGLGKTTLAWKALPLLAPEKNLCVLFCHETETATDPIEQLTGQLLKYCRDRFGSQWDAVTQAVDRAGGESLARFKHYLIVLVQNVKPFVLYLDNLESLLQAPRAAANAMEKPPDPDEFARWRSGSLRQLWQHLNELVEAVPGFRLVASCRYCNDDFAEARIPLSPLPTAALYRMMGWFRWLNKLSPPTRLKLAGRLHGHPRAVDFANDLMHKAWQTHGAKAKKPMTPNREWEEVVAPILPGVQEKLWDDLLLAQIWEVVLTESARRMLYRMTLLRLPWVRELMDCLGEEGELLAATRSSADFLTTSSLLQEIDYLDSQGQQLHKFSLHPSTADFIRQKFPQGEALRQDTHFRVGTFLEEWAQKLGYVEDIIEAGWHLFQAGEYNRSYDLLGVASDWLQDHGRVREGLDILMPFIESESLVKLDKLKQAQVFGTLGLAHHRLGEVRKAIEYHEKALGIDREISYETGVGQDLGNLGLAYADLGEIRKAIEYYEAQLEIVREVGDKQGAGNALGNLGAAYFRLGEVQKAIEYYEKALKIIREIKDRRGEGNVLCNLGSAYGDLGEIRKAIEYHKEALKIDREIGSKGGEGEDLTNLGSDYWRLGDINEARMYYEQALTIGRQVEDPRIISGCESALKKLNE